MQKSGLNCDIRCYKNHIQAILRKKISLDHHIIQVLFFITWSAALKKKKKDLGRFKLRHGQILTGINQHTFVEDWLRRSLWLGLCIIEHTDMMTI